MKDEKWRDKYLAGYIAACKLVKNILVDQNHKVYEREGREVLDDTWSQIDKLEKIAFQEMPTVISDLPASPSEEEGNPPQAPGRND